MYTGVRTQFKQEYSYINIDIYIEETDFEIY